MCQSGKQTSPCTSCWIQSMLQKVKYPSGSKIKTI
uniref:Uncharacterized protein n=1 Tax=Anguilla anguilla TaxID=7936 RepID=A0A0E9SGI0_ANGAN